MVLVVDDDPMFLQNAEGNLNMARGILLAANADQAKDLMRMVGAEVKLLVIDLDLPNEDGFSLIRQMRRHFPDLPVIAMSGVVQAHVLESAKLFGAEEVLRKPIGPEWTRMIERLLDRAA